MTTYTSMLRRSVPAVVTLALCVVLAGCGATSDATSSPSTEWTGPTNPVVTPKPPTPVNGETLTTQEQIEAAETAGLTVYEMADGTKVAIDPSQDLPQQVADEGAAMTQANAAEKMDLSTAFGRATEFVDKTGKNLIFIFPIYGSIDGETDEMFYVAAGGVPVYGDATFPTRDPAPLVASLQAWAAAQPNPETYQVIVVPMP